MWLWERAIVQGYAVFRELQVTHSGVVTDMATRQIWLEPMSEEDCRHCGLDDPLQVN